MTDYYLEGVDIPPEPRSTYVNGFAHGCTVWHRLNPPAQADQLGMIQRMNFMLSRPEGSYHHNEGLVIKTYWVWMRALTSIGECYHGGASDPYWQQIYEADLSVME